MTKSRDNHYVPQWYQRGFILDGSNELHYLDLKPDSLILSDGRTVELNSRSVRPPSCCFYRTDLYTTFFGALINDEIERMLFGRMDDLGARAIRAFIGEDVTEWHNNFENLFSFLDTQKIRTPKGLDWVARHYPKLGQVDLMQEMQAISNMHCTIWSEGVREVVTAKTSKVKFIVSDHPITIYNHACPPDVDLCAYPNDPSIALKGTQTIYPMDMNHCLILTNLEYANEPDSVNALEKRTNPRLFRTSMVRTDTFIRSRSLDEKDVVAINYIIKSRACRYIAAGDESWLYPEQHSEQDWASVRNLCLPPKHELGRYGGELYVGYQDGSTYYQDAFGRTNPKIEFLQKDPNYRPGRNDLCGCGSGKKFKKCCLNRREADRPGWKELSIRERNIVFASEVADILGLSKHQSWDDVRESLDDARVREIHELYEFLWPIDTDLIELLPKPDDSMRVLYTGVVDPRIVCETATCLTSYFDELIVQQPFVVPGSVKPKFCPVKNPHQHKQQTLKNIHLLLTLMPLIEAGRVNFIPDPCAFDRHLQGQMLGMAETRTTGFRFSSEERQHLEELHKDDFLRTIWSLPNDRKHELIRRAMPELSDEKIGTLIAYIVKMMQNDPLSLLQSDVLGADGGQLLTMNMIPNFEISMFIAQSTGAAILTNSQYRWGELKRAQSRSGGLIKYNLPELSNLFGEILLPVYFNPDETLKFGSTTECSNIRDVLRDTYRIVCNAQSTTKPFEIDRLRQNLLKYGGALRDENADRHVGIECLIPKGGIVHNNVQNLLLTSGVERCRKSVPLAMFVHQRS